MDLRALLASDEKAIHEWPPYTGYYARLDYALRTGKEGWLIHYPDSHKLGGYVDNRLIGFSLLVEDKEAKSAGFRRAEFYVAMHPDEIGTKKGYGRELCEKTLEHAFAFLQLDEVWLKVRVDHEWGMKHYPKLEFVEEGRFEEKVDGKPVTFCKMSIKKGDYLKRA